MQGYINPTPAAVKKHTRSKGCPKPVKGKHTFFFFFKAPKLGEDGVRATGKNTERGNDPSNPLY